VPSPESTITPGAEFLTGLDDEHIREAISSLEDHSLFYWAD
jgi:hypothetical protein